MANPMTAKAFKKVKPRDLTNGACRDEIEDALLEREKLLRLVTELDAEMDGVNCPWSAAAILNALRQIVTQYQ